MLSVGVIIYSLISHEEVYTHRNLWSDIGLTFCWSVAGMALLVIARIICHKTLLSNVIIRDALVKQKNLGIGIIECGVFIGSAFIIKSAFSGEEMSLIIGIISSLIFYIIGQLGFVVWMGLNDAKIGT